MENVIFLLESIRNDLKREMNMKSAIRKLDLYTKWQTFDGEFLLLPNLIRDVDAIPFAMFIAENQRSQNWDNGNIRGNCLVTPLSC